MYQITITTVENYTYFHRTNSLKDALELAHSMSSRTFRCFLKRV